MALTKGNFTEAVYSPGVKVDREAGVIRDVKVLGRESRNNREYTKDAVTKAVPLYEGQTVFLDHPDRKTPGAERSVKDGWGSLTNAREKPDGIYADLQYLKSHPYTEALVERAERFPNTFGLSHNAGGMHRKAGGKTIVESVELVRSVDLVSKPATTNGLFESEDGVTTEPTTLAEFLETLDETQKQTAGGKFLLEMMGADPTAGDYPMGPGQMGEGADGGQVKAGLVSALMALAKGMSEDELIGEVKRLMKGKGGDMSDENKGGKGEKGGKPGENRESVDAGNTDALKTLTESVQSLTDELAEMKRKQAAVDFLESEGLTAADLDPNDKKAIFEAADDEGRKAAFEAIPPYRRKARAASGRRADLMESGAAKTEYPKSREDFVKGIKSGW